VAPQLAASQEGLRSASKYTVIVEENIELDGHKNVRLVIIIPKSGIQI
jgi:hypothetical protein